MIVPYLRGYGWTQVRIRILVLVLLPQGEHTRLPRCIARSSRANMNTGISPVASVTICRKKPRRPLPRLWSTSTVSASPCGLMRTARRIEGGLSSLWRMFHGADIGSAHHAHGDTVPRLDTADCAAPTRASRSVLLSVVCGCSSLATSPVQPV